MADLILVPTAGERSVIETALTFDADRWQICTVGLGVVASAVATSLAIKRWRPDRVVLAGIAGLFDSANSRSSFQIGQAAWQREALIDGIGIGQRDQFQNARSLGWHWYDGHEDHDGLGLGIPQSASENTVSSGALLTVCSASADANEADWRSKRYPGASGEDMETFAVALACQQCGLSLHCVRGYSNRVGNRDHSQWQIDEALASVTYLLQDFLDTPI